MIYSVASPTRVDLSGGTLDLWPLYLFTNGALTINMAISIWTRVDLEPHETPEIVWESADYGAVKRYGSAGECLASVDPDAQWLRILVRAFAPPTGFRLRTGSDSPVGGGLGGSSSLWVSCYKAFRQWLPGEKLGIETHVQNIAHLEAEMMHAPPGTQDYYPAFCGGVNLIDYQWNHIQHRCVSLKGSPLERNFMLVYTGRSHHSGINNFEVLTRAVQKDRRTMGALSEVKAISEDMKRVLESAEWAHIPELFRREYAARLQLADSFASPEIHALNDLCLKEGASAVKICGAGGGGCVLVWTEPELKAKVGQACERKGFRVLNAVPVEPLE